MGVETYLAVFLAISYHLLVCCNCQANHSRVLILGAGASGISFANTMMKAGWTNFTILEARDYIGGRMRKSKLGSTTVELGASWIQGIGPDNPLWILKQKYNLSTVPDNITSITVRDVNNKIYANWSSDFQELLKKSEQIAEESYIEEEEKKPDKPLRTSLSQHGILNDDPVAAALEYFLIDYENAAPPEVITARQVAFSGGLGMDHLVTDPRGFSYLFEEMAINFTDKIYLNTTVTKIRYRANEGVIVETADGVEYTSDYVVVTFSNGVLAKRKLFEPELPQWKYDAIYQLPMAQYTHIFLRFPISFWDSTHYVLLSNVFRGYYTVWSNFDRFGFFPGENILVVVVTGFESLRVERMTDAQVQEELMVVLKKAYGVGIPNPTDFQMSRWSVDPYCYGAYISPVVGTDSLVFEHMKQPVNKTVWFAGESLEAEDWGFVHGAFNNGESQATAFMSCISDNKCPLLRMRNATCASSVNGNAKPLIVGNVTMLILSLSALICSMLGWTVV